MAVHLWDTLADNNNASIVDAVVAVLTMEFWALVDFAIYDYSKKEHNYSHITYSTYFKFDQSTAFDAGQQQVSFARQMISARAYDNRKAICNTTE